MAVAFVDTHAHIQGREFANDIEAVLERARAGGVSTVVVPAEDRASSDAAVALAAAHAGVYAAVGVHPHEADKLTPGDFERIESLLAHDRVVAVGEIGLDFYRMLSPVAAQIETLERMLDLALRHELPVVIHRREAEIELTRRLERWAAQATPRYGGRPLGVMHYYGGDESDARRHIEMGFMLSIHTSVTHPKAGARREVVAILPLDRLVIETDAPYGSPQAYRGKRNEPAYVIEAAKAIAAAQGVGLAEVAAATTENACRLFGITLGESVGAASGAVS